MTNGIAAGRWLFAQNCAFRLGVADPDGLPPPDRDEVAFAGRSNVGKSSLINALTGRDNLARISNTPGRTQELNFFALPAEAAGALHLVDLPGYGYARESKGKIAAWQSLTRDYLRGRACLRRVFVLIDARHGLKSNDHATLNILDEAAVNYQLVATKIDKISETESDTLAAALAEAARARPAAHPDIIRTSSRTKAGIDELRAAIARLADLESLGYKAGGTDR